MSEGEQATSDEEKLRRICAGAGVEMPETVKEMRKIADKLVASVESGPVGHLYEPAEHRKAKR